MAEAKPSLVFVYNADSGVFNTLSDMAHKLFSPKTYQCNLCALTYSNVRMRKEWKQFIETLNASVEFLHRDELKTHYAIDDVELPAVFCKQGECLTVWLTAEEINRCKTMAKLEKLICEKLSEAHQS